MAANDSLRTTVAVRIDALCQQFEAAWQGGERPKIEQFVEQAGPAELAALFRELLHIELAYRQKHGERPTPDDYLPRFPERAAEIALALAFSRADVGEGSAKAADGPNRPRGADRNLLFGVLAL